MNFYYEGWDDPRKPGVQYVAVADEKYIIEYIRTETDNFFGAVTFIFKSPSGTELRIGRTQLRSSYKLYVDPWASQKAWAKQYGFKFIEPSESDPIKKDG